MKKFINNVEQITYSGDFGRKFDQEVLYVTERAVFRLSEKGIVLIEIAPGIDLKKDVLELMDFTPEISDDLKLMDSRIFEG